MKCLTFSFLLLSLTGTASLWAAPKTFESTQRLTPLLELYTSEGCSSCPPADDFLQSLEKDPGLWIKYIPIAFHVDYWDYLGWKDRFSSKANTDRQRSYAKAWRDGSVFTPAFVLDGEIWRARPSSPTLGSPARPAPHLKLSVSNNEFAIEVRGLKLGGCYETLLTPILKHSKNKVSAGENKGRVLNHSFAALDLISTPLKFDRGIATAKGKIKKSGADAIAAWVQRCSNPTPLQAVGGEL